MCRGNFKSGSIVTGSLDPLAERLFNELPHDRFLIEWDHADHTGGIAELKTRVAEQLASQAALKVSDLAIGGNYSRSESIVLPPAFTGRFTIFVKADGTGGVFEDGVEANNVDRSEKTFSSSIISSFICFLGMGFPWGRAL